MVADEGRARDRGARFLIIAASLVIVVAGLRAAGQLILPFLVSVFLAIISLPLMKWLQRKGAPTGVAVLVTVLADVAVLAGLLIIVGRAVNEFTAAAPSYQARLQQLMGFTLAWIEARGIETAGWSAPEFINPGALVDLVGGTLRAVAAVAQNTFLVILTMIFILSEAAGFSDKLRVAFGSRPGNLERFGSMAEQVQRYLAIKTLVSLATGVLVGVWVSALGLDFPLLWGLVAFIFNYIPNLGSILAAVPPVLLAAVQFGPGRAAGVAIGYVVINIVLANFVEPYFMGRRLGLSTLVVILSLVFWGWVWGPVGMLLSVPLTVIVKIALENTEDFRWVAVMLGVNPARRARPGSSASDRAPETDVSLLKFLGLSDPPTAQEEVDTETVRRIIGELERLEPDRARYLAAFAYVLGRIAHADQHVSDAELDKMQEIIRELGHLPDSQALLVVQIAKRQNAMFGSTEDFLVTRQFREMATPEQRRELLDCVFAVAAADDSISTAEDSRTRQIASELGLGHAEYIEARTAYSAKRDVIRSFRDRLGGHGA